MSGETIPVFCEDHEDPWLVDEFTRVDGNWISAQSMPGPWQRGGKTLRRSSADAFGFVDASGKWDRDNGHGGPGWPNSRHNLKRKLCGTVPVRRDNLKSVLDVLDANGEPSISLAALAARLPRGKRH